MIAYFDSSALVKLFLPEPGSEQARRVWQSGIPLATSRVSHAELACALAGGVRGGRSPSLDPGVVDGTFLRESADLIEADDRVITAAAVLGTRHGLRGMDAIHLSSALRLADLEPLVVSWDNRQRRAARAEGLPVYP